MAIQFSVALRNAQVGAIQTTTGSSGTLLILTGSVPATCATAQSGSLLATITLPTTFLTSSGGSTTIAGTWSTSATGTGTAGYFRILDVSSNCVVQGNVTSDLVLNNTSIASGQTVTVTTFTVTAANS